MTLLVEALGDRLQLLGDAIERLVLGGLHLALAQRAPSR